MATQTQLVVFDAPGTFTWTADPALMAIDLIVIGAGGSGASGMSHSTALSRIAGPGGGGGATNATQKRLGRIQIGETVEVIVGAGGAAPVAPPATNGAWTPGNDGGHSAFGDLLRAEGGRGGGYEMGMPDPVITVGGAAGFGVMRGGRGGSATGTADGGSTSSDIVRFLAGAGGGGRGAGQNPSGSPVARGLGGTASPTYGGGNWRTTLALTHRAGNGGTGATTTVAATAGEVPGGGGGGGAGAAVGIVGAAGAHGRVIVIEYLRVEEP